jgi:hypothetical protein
MVILTIGSMINRHRLGIDFINAIWLPKLFSDTL